MESIEAPSNQCKPIKKAGALKCEVNLSKQASTSFLYSTSQPLWCNNGGLSVSRIQVLKIFPVQISSGFVTNSQIHKSRISRAQDSPIIEST